MVDGEAQRADGREVQHGLAGRVGAHGAAEGGEAQVSAATRSMRRPPNARAGRA
jgi:hypothetical protein